MHIPSITIIGITNEYNIRCYHTKGILTVGRKFGLTSSGLDGVTVGLQKFKKFIKKEYPLWRHMILEGNKFITNREMHDFLLEGDYDFKLYCPDEFLKRREHKELLSLLDDRLHNWMTIRDNDVLEIRNTLKTYKSQKLDSPVEWTISSKTQR